MTHVPWHPDVDKSDLTELHGIESVQLTSVGIDIGTTTSQLLISEMVARRGGSEYSSKFQITDRETVFESPIRLTPYEGKHRIDAERLERQFQHWYAEAGYQPKDIDTGAVIITGEANRKENADRIIELFSQQSGRFVCATAGANLESLMAAHGSGAVDLSLDAGAEVLNVDIGGGTTKLSRIDEGIVQETAAINVGARLIAFDEEERVDRLEDAAIAVADDVGVNIELGGKLSESERRQIARRFAQALFELLDGDMSPLAESLMVTDVPSEPLTFNTMTFSGGGSEYVYDRDPGYHNDLGKDVGKAIRSEIEDRKLDVVELDSGIRATAVGSNQHTVQVSGNTITITTESDLPMRNVPMVPFVADHDDDLRQLTENIRDRLEMYDIDDLTGGFAFGFHIHGLPNYEFLRRIVDAAAEAREEMDAGGPFVLAFDADVALNAGRIADDVVDAPVIAIDGVELDQFGYIDIGEPLDDTNAVPLTVKSLLFEG